MRTITRLALALAVPLAVAGCEGENLFANADPELVNDTPTFEAVRFDFVNGAGETFDLIEENARFELELDEEQGRFESDFRFDDIDIQVTGTFVQADRSIIFSDDPLAADDLVMERTFTFEEAGDVLFLGDPAVVWDIDNDGVDEVGSLDIRLELLD